MYSKFYFILKYLLNLKLQKYYINKKFSSPYTDPNVTYPQWIRLNGPWGQWTGYNAVDQQMHCLGFIYLILYKKILLV